MHALEVEPAQRATESLSRFSPMTVLARGAISQWLLHCADPLGPKGNPPRFSLSPAQVRRLMLKADAHKVLPAVFRHFPLPADDPAFKQVRLEANARKVEAAALSTMLGYHAGAILDEAKGLPVALVKGPAFARLYPSGLRPFGDIDLLAAPAALPELASIVGAHGFRRVVGGYNPSLMEDTWVHAENNVLTVEVHTNLVHSARMRPAFSLAYEDIEGGADTAGALLAVAVTHGAMHYFAWLRHVVDICQAARAVTTPEEESRFELLTGCTGTRMAAIIGLMIAYRLLGEARCLELAQALGPARNYRFGRFLIEGAVVTAPMEGAIVYNSWRRFIFRETLRHGTLASDGKPAHRDQLPFAPVSKLPWFPTSARRREQGNVRVLAFTCSRHRPLMLRHCIMQMQRQSYPVDHVIYVNSSEEPGENYTTLHYQMLLRDVCHNSTAVTRIAYGPSGTYHQNYCNALKLARIDDYDLFLKVDDDDIYLKDYVLGVVRDFAKHRWDYSGAASRGHLNGCRWRPNTILTGLGLADDDTNIGIPDFMPPTIALSRRAISALRTLEDCGIFEDIQWRRHLSQVPGFVMAFRKDRNFIYNIHGDNASTGAHLEA